MKKLLTIFSVFIIYSCSNIDEVTSNQLVERKNIVYKINSEVPYSGISIEYYLDSLLLNALIENDLEEKKIKEKITYEKGIKIAQESFHSSGQVQAIYNYENAEFDGNQKTYYANGQLETSENYKLGEYEGLQEYYYEDGQLKESANYRMGEFDGNQKTYYANGQLETSENYKLGEYEGLQEYYYEDGQLESRKNFKLGEYEGLQEYYYEDGQLSRNYNYKNDLLHGPREAYYENGNIKYKNIYEEGILVFEEQWNAKGLKEKDFSIVAGEKRETRHSYDYAYDENNKRFFINDVLVKDSKYSIDSGIMQECYYDDQENYFCKVSSTKVDFYNMIYVKDGLKKTKETFFKEKKIGEINYINDSFGTNAKMVEDDQPGSLNFKFNNIKCNVSALGNCGSRDNKVIYYINYIAPEWIEIDSYTRECSIFYYQDSVKDIYNKESCTAMLPALPVELHF
jgi:antitoxin component YwqK of YwqJK toxin-antitoxin module